MSNYNLDAVNALRNKLFKILTSSSTPQGVYLSFVPAGMAQSDYTLKFLTDPSATSQAADFAFTSNSVPVSIGDWVNTGTELWDVYEDWLNRYVPVPSRLTPGEKTLLKDAIKAVEDLYINYVKYQAEWQAAYADWQYYVTMPKDERSSEYRRNLIKAKNKLDRAKSAWDILGKKIEYETQYAIRIDLGERDSERAKLRLKQKFGAASSSDNGEYYPTRITPANLMDPEFEWTKFSFSSSEIKEYTDDASYSWGASAEYESLLWNVGVDHEGKHITSEKETDISNMIIEFEILRAPIIRPWFSTFLLKSRFWKWPGSTPSDPSGGDWLSDGKLPAIGRLQMIPTEAIFVRNLKVKLDMESTLNKRSLTETESALKGGWGPFQIKGNVKTSNGSTTFEFNKESDGISCEQPQIIAFFCELLPKSPNPNFKLWEGTSSSAATHMISGRVIHEEKRWPLGGLRIEAWDDDVFVDDFLACSTTDANGQFELQFDPARFSESFLDRKPDLYFKVYQDDELLETSAVMKNLEKGHHGTTILCRPSPNSFYAWPGYPSESNSSPYGDLPDVSNTRISVQTPFSNKQKAALIAANIERNGELISDYYGLSSEILPQAYAEYYQVLRVPHGLAPLVRDFGVTNFKECDPNEPDAAQIDHIIAMTKNGSNSFLNAAVCSRQCNLGKGNTTISTLIYNYA